MKHAICLLAYKDYNYITSFIDQFNNHPDILFYIHWHNHSDEECEKLKKYSDKIVYINNLYRTYRFSINLVRAELNLYFMASQNEDIKYFHLMSESDYLICDVNYFIDYFNKYEDNDFLIYINDNDYNCNLFYDYNDNIYKASQWKTLSKNTINYIIEHIQDLFFLIKRINYNTVLGGAFDEFIIPTFLKNTLYKDNDKLINDSKRYIRWSHSIYYNNQYIDDNSHPSILTTDLYNEKYYKVFRYNHYVDVYDPINESVILNNLIIRKIDIFNEKSKDFLNNIKEKFKENIKKI